MKKLVLLLPFILLQCGLSDIRNEYTLKNQINEKDAQKGRALLAQLEKHHGGRSNWQRQKNVSVQLTDE